MQPADTIPRRDGAPAPAARRWSAWRVLAVVLGSLVTLAGLAAIGAGVTALVFDGTQRDASGYLMTGSTEYSTSTYALVSDSYRTGGIGDWRLARDLLGTVRVRSESSRPVFVGIGRAGAVDSYLAGVEHEIVPGFDTSHSDRELHAGGAPAAPPAGRGFWAARTAGSGTQTLEWTPRDGDWRVVVMRPDGSAGVRADIAVGARFPHLLAIGAGTLGAGAGLLLIGAWAVFAAVRRP